MKATKKNIKEAVKNYISTRNLTQFCKSMKLMGITKQLDILNAVEEVACKRDANAMWHIIMGAHGYRRYDKVATLHSNLDESPVFAPSQSEDTNFVSGFANRMKSMRANKDSGSYMKVLVVGNKHIYWASPVYQHSDYNKSVWRENAAENRRKAEIINAYLLK